jgi:acyl dehydratase
MSGGWFEDIEIGSRRELGSHTFTQDEIIAFAKKYDPQVFHIDPEAAKHSMFGGIIASGWHTAAMWMRLAVESRTLKKRN